MYHKIITSIWLNFQSCVLQEYNAKIHCNHKFHCSNEKLDQIGCYCRYKFISIMVESCRHKLILKCEVAFWVETTWWGVEDINHACNVMFKSLKWKIVTIVQVFGGNSWGRVGLEDKQYLFCSKTQGESWAFLEQSYPYFQA